MVEEEEQINHAINASIKSEERNGRGFTHYYRIIVGTLF
jgi:hypothetical protein